MNRVAPPAPAGAGLPRVDPGEVGLSAERLARVGAALGREIEMGRMPGAVVAVARGGRLALLEAHGHRDREAGVPMTEDTLFWAASMTKPLTAASALALHERGLLDLDAPLSAHLPQFAGARVADLEAPGASAALATVAARREPTIRDLMRHTSGIVEGLLGSTRVHELYADAVGDGMTSFTGAEFAERLSGVPLLHQPGELWHYGWGMDLLGLIVESIAGTTLGEHLHDSVLAPLAMHDTSFGLPAERAGRYARPLPRDADTGAPLAMPDLSRARFHSGGAGVVTTAGDYVRFAAALAGGGLACGSRILGRKVVELMTADQLDAGADVSRLAQLEPSLAGYGFGLGVAVRRRVAGAVPGSIGDVTWPGASGSCWWADPREELAVVLMTHTPTRAARHRNVRLARATVYQAIVD